jgi:hypothetical protein
MIFSQPHEVALNQLTPVILPNPEATQASQRVVIYRLLFFFIMLCQSRGH